MQLNTTHLAHARRTEYGLRKTLSLVLLWGLAAFYVSLFAPITAKWCNNIFFAFVLLPTVMSLRWQDWRNFHRQRWLNLYCALIVYLLLSNLWSAEFSSERFIRFANRAGYLYGFIFALYLIHTRFVFSSRLTVLWIGVTAAMLSIPLLIFISNYHPAARLELIGQFANPNDAAILSAALIGITLQRWSASDKTARCILGISIAVLLACIIFGQSRSGLAALVACALCAVILRRSWLLGLILLALIVTSIWGPGTGIWLERGLSFRDGIWAINWQHLQHCGALGCGLGTSSGGMVNGVMISHTHSILFGMLFYGGVVALLLYLTLIVRSLRAALSSSPSIVAGIMLLAGFVGTLVTSDQILVTPDPIWIYLLAPLALICFETQSATNEEVTSP